MSLRIALPALFVLAFASPAAAQVQDVPMPPSEVAARGHYLMGREHYEAGRFEAAAREFQEAYELSHRADLFYNLFLAHRDAGHTREAATALRQYIEAVPDAPQIEVLRARLVTLEAQVAEADARAAATTTTTSPDPTTTATSSTTTSTTSTTSTPTSTTADPSSVDTASSTSSTSSGTEASVAPWIVVGVGGALAIGAVVTGALTASTYGDLSSSCPGGACPAGYDVEGQRSSGQTLALTTDVLGGVAAATLAAGLVWAIVDATSQSPSDDSSHAALRCSPLGCRGSF